MANSLVQFHTDDTPKIKTAKKKNNKAESVLLTWHYIYKDN